MKRMPANKHAKLEPKRVLLQSERSFNFLVNEDDWQVFKKFNSFKHQAIFSSKND